MAGIVGVFRYTPLKPEDREEIVGLARTLDHSRMGAIEIWNDEHLCIAQVRLAVGPAVGPAVHASSESVLFFHGRLGDGGKRSAAAARCLEAWETGGPAGLAGLNGQFNLVVHDGKARALFLANDRFGAHPLFYHATSERLVFASQVAGVLHRDVPRRLDLSAVRQFFVFQTILGEGTFLDGVRALPPAGLLRYRASEVEVTRYWALRYLEDDGRSERHHAERLAAALDGAVRRGIGDGRGLGVLLSGGLDSRALVARPETPLHAVTLADWDNAEVHGARDIASRRGLPFTFVRRSPDHYVRLVDLGVALGDGAYRYDNAHFAGLRGRVPAHVQGLVSGYGFDLLLKGDAVPKRRLRIGDWPVNRHAMVEIPTPASVDDLVEVVLDTQRDCLWRHPGTAAMFLPDHRRGFVEDVRGAVANILRRGWDRAPGPLQRCELVRMDMLATRFNAYLNVLSIRHFFRDVTVAFDNEILDQHTAIPPRLRLDGRAYREALRLLAPDLYRLKDANSGARPGTHYLVTLLQERARHLGERLGFRRRPTPPDPVMTQGSWPNMGELIRQRPALTARLRATLADPASLPDEVFDRRGLRGMLADHLERRQDATWPLLLLLTFGTWHRAVVAREPALTAADGTAA
jgi:asparagine synthase (glutamine-hydrolysing)